MNQRIQKNRMKQKLENMLLEERLGNDVYEFQGKTGTLQKCKIAEKEREW